MSRRTCANSTPPRKPAVRSRAVSSRGFQVAGLVDVLRSVAIRPGDTVVMHSSLMHLGRPEDCSLHAYPQRVIDAILDYLGDRGTLAVPAPNWDYSSKGVPFDVRSSPVERSIGVLSTQFISRPRVERSANPIFSVAAIGRQARDICRPDTGSAFGIDSAWDRLFNLGARILMLGSGFDTLTFIRYIEFRFGVPYLYNKLFMTPVLDGGRSLPISITAPLRFRHCQATYNLHRFEEMVRRAGVAHDATFGAGIASMVTMADCFRLGIEALKEDIHFFLRKAPDYVQGSIPVS